MRKLTQPFGEFGSSMSVSIQGADLRTAEGKRTLNAVYGEIARFVLACRATPSNGQQYDAKTINRPLWSAQYSKIAAQEFLRVQLRGGQRVEKKEEKKVEENPQMKCMLILFGTNKLVATDMYTVGKGQVGSVVYTATAKTSNWGEPEKNPRGPELELPEANAYRRTIQLRNNAKMGNVAMTNLKWDNGKITAEEYYYVWRITDEKILCAENEYNAYWISHYPSLYATDSLIYAGAQSFDAELNVTSDNVWGEEIQEGFYYDAGRPAWIDHTGTSYWNVSASSPTEPTSEEMGEAIFDENYGWSTLYPPQTPPPEYANSHKRSTSGGLTSLQKRQFPQVYLKQEDGLDVVYTRESSTAGTEGYYYAGIVDFYVEGKLIVQAQASEMDNYRLYAFSWPYTTDPDKYSWYRYGPNYFEDMHGNTNSELPLGDGWRITGIQGLVCAANGKHYVQGYHHIKNDDSIINTFYYIDDVEANSSFAAAIGAGVEEIEAVFLDVPLALIKQIK